MVTTRQMVKEKKDRTKKNLMQKEKMIAYHQAKKQKRATSIRDNEVIRLLDSSVQESKYQKRTGSTLVMATGKTWIQIGNKLLDIIKEDNYKKKIFTK